MTHYRVLVQTFYCDAEGCVESFEAHGSTQHNAWLEAREDGWRAVASGVGPFIHMCPRHSIRKSDDLEPRS